MNNKAHSNRDHSRFNGIHIKAQNRGKFTAAAKKHGEGVQTFASQVLGAAKGAYSPGLRKQANFARNFGGRSRD